MIDALFGSKTRVKLLHLFLNNPEKSFYVREITRLIDEQINSVRRELANMLNVGIILSDNADNKLYYTVNRQYDYYEPLRGIFADKATTAPSKGSAASSPDWVEWLRRVPGLRIAVAAGKLVRGSASGVDLLLVGSLSTAQVAAVIKKIEKAEGREINYAVMPYDDFYYRLSVRDKFVAEIIQGACRVLVDAEHVIKSGKGSVC
ncbi:MAG: transcriptional regulator [Candidatus Saccharibacteria bacterium]|nr:transcriptional regulator [Candidatus Saccharibacteria bacterium]